MARRTRYAKAGKLNIAYQVVGDGPIDLVVVPGWISNIEIFWEDPHVARFFEKLAMFTRLILFDKRGTGLSDRSIEAATLEERMDDMRAVLDAVGSVRAALLGYSEGGAMCLLFAATYPERTAALITIGSYARRLRASDYPYFTNREEALAALEAATADWGGPVWAELRIRSVADDPIILQWWARFLRMSASASAAAALQRMNLEIDVRHVLPSVQAPALILHAKHDPACPVGTSRQLAENMPHAELVEIESGDHLPFYDKPDEVLQHIERFLTGGSTTENLESRVSTLMFTDIVASTEMAVAKGDLRFGDLLETAPCGGARRACTISRRGSEYLRRRLRGVVRWSRAGSQVRFGDQQRFACGRHNLPHWLAHGRMQRPARPTPGDRVAYSSEGRGVGLTRHRAGFADGKGPGSRLWPWFS